jgi:hypothetical protein
MRTLIIAMVLIAAGAGLGAGYLMWGQPTNWYAVDVTRLGKGAENGLIRYGRELADRRYPAPYRQGTRPIQPCVSPVTTSPARTAI